MDSRRDCIAFAFVQGVRWLDAPIGGACSPHRARMPGMSSRDCMERGQRQRSAARDVHPFYDIAVTGSVSSYDCISCLEGQLEFYARPKSARANEIRHGIDSIRF